MIRMQAYRLGAEELLELGTHRRRPIQNLGHAPFFSRRRQAPMLGNPRPQMGQLDILLSVAEWLAKGLGFMLNTLGDIVDIPLDILAQGVDVAFSGVASLLGNIPIIGSLLAEIVLVGSAIIQFGLTVPGLILHGLGNIIEGIGMALDQDMTEDEKQEELDGAKDKIVEDAPEPIKDNVKAILDAVPVDADNVTSSVVDARREGQVAGGTAGKTPEEFAAEPPVEKSFLEQALPIAIPVAGVAVLIALLAR